MDPSLSRFRGAMAGLAVGDALGAPLEGLKSGRIRQVYGRVENFVDPGLAWQDKPWRWRMPGLYTDDTQQALILADTLVKCHGFDASFFANRLLEMAEAESGAEFGAFRGTGRQFREALKRLRQGVKPLLAGNLSAGIGASMRVAPAGLYYAESEGSTLRSSRLRSKASAAERRTATASGLRSHFGGVGKDESGGDEEDITRAAVEQGLVTNRDPRALEAAAGVAFCVACGASGKWQDKKPEVRVEMLIQFMETADHIIREEYLPYLPVETWDHCGRVASAVRNFRFYLNMESASVWKQIVGEANRGFPGFKISDPTQGFALAGPVTAMFLGIISRSYSEGVLCAVNLGRDTDTVAAITGAILGAREGQEQIPDNWQKEIQNLPQVLLRGDALWQSSFQGLAIEDVIQMEQRLTRKESTAREALREKLSPPGRKKDTKRGKIPPGRKTAEPQKEPRNLEESLLRRKKLKKPRKVKAPWRGGKG
jgi:ADP-ribosyl-[dinitrogen reductase] hydrolase